MSDAFDPFNLLILAIALFFVWRLRGVLGRRTGNERKPFDPFNSSETAERSAEDREIAGNVVNLPDKQAKADADRAETEIEDDDRPPIWEGVAEGGTPLAETLTTIAEIDADFVPEDFLRGARKAYEMILRDFDTANRKDLKKILSTDVYEAFDAAITDREKAGRTVESSFIGIDSANIIDASVKGKTADLTVKFVSQLISATLDREGKVVDGDPQQVREVMDIWTFSRDLSSKDPNWKLIATEAAN